MATSTTLTPEQRTARARKAGKASQAPEVLASRLVRDWPKLTPEQHHGLRSILRPITGPRT